eukprot:CAMPEP_0185776514 /NCGR_PEP_ID=MMETSP1174-20130828/85918_1 /TAXON_ID=35687 /ORGANISM="Dictyocha speculum, Strain CCMP1381" /LENGTH=204 /DNA_ID=CAMNT_0028464495 /DNA_START=173 /DNA_END=787 /DNA_ORIENTATION=-
MTPSSAKVDVDDISRLKLGLAQLDILLADWDSATLNCKYAEVNKQLLEDKNKEALLDAATQNAMFDKGSTKSICKRDPEIVRLVLGLTDKIKGKSGPPAMFATPGIYRTDETEFYLVGADKLIEMGLKTLDDNFDAYVSAQERWIEAKSALNGMSYVSGVADLGAILQASDAKSPSNSGYLDASKLYAEQCRDSLKIVVGLLGL